MSLRSGETVNKSGEYKCEKCHTEVYVTNGRKLPKCPNCGNESFDNDVVE
jgi:Zn finger protein HypA/HybF involved in hydrogenase expression